MPDANGCQVCECVFETTTTTTTTTTTAATTTPAATTVVPVTTTVTTTTAAPASGRSDSCQWSNDGMCDEPWLCSEGTDCTDCKTCSSPATTAAPTTAAPTTTTAAPATTAATTAAPGTTTAGGSGECVDRTLDFAPYNGAKWYGGFESFDCATFGSSGFCATFGSRTYEDRPPANLYCCACGGGIVDGVPVTAAPTTAGPTTTAPPATTAAATTTTRDFPTTTIVPPPLGSTTAYVPSARRRAKKVYAAADGSATHCKPRDGSLQRRERREIHLWSDEQFAEFSWAVNLLKSRSGTEYPKTYDSFASQHPNGHLPNRGPLFLPWHRKFLQDFETALQVEADNCDLAVPYWNSHLEAGDLWGSVVWNSNRYGGRVEYTPPSAATGFMDEFKIPNAEKCEDILDLGFVQIKNVDFCITDGISGGWSHPGGFGCTGKCVHRRPGSGRLNSFASVVAYLERNEKFETMNQWLDGQHAAMHASIVGGDMGNVNDSPIDPVFFLHHGFVDRMFAWWQEYHTLKGGAPTATCDDCARTLPLYNVPYTDWMGQFDTNLNCIPLPASNPNSCISYVGHHLEGTVTFSLAQQKLGQPTGTSVCEAHMDMLVQGRCSEGIELESIENTCPCPGGVLRDGCTNWIQTMTDMSREQVEHKTAQCIETLEETVIKPEKDRPMAKAVTTEESRLCIRCNFKCQGAPMPPEGESGVEVGDSSLSQEDSSFVDRLTALIR